MKILKQILGVFTEFTTIQTSAGAADADKIVSLDNNGRFDISVMPAGVTIETKGIVCSENLNAGDFVNVFLNGAVANARKADASAANTGKKAVGYVLQAFTAGQTAIVYYGNINSSVSGLTIGAEYYLSSSVAGAITTTPPSTAGFCIQRLGVAVSATELLTEISSPIVLA